MENLLKCCGKCGVHKPRDAFGRHAGKPDGLQSTCRDCRRAWSTGPGNEGERGLRKRAYNREYCQRPENQYRRRLRRYGLTEDQFGVLVAKRDGRCHLSGCSEAGANIDHNARCCPVRPVCGRCVRGLLCEGHNRGLGHFHDDPRELRAGADYLDGSVTAHIFFPPGPMS